MAADAQADDPGPAGPEAAAASGDGTGAIFTGARAERHNVEYAWQREVCAESAQQRPLARPVSSSVQRVGYLLADFRKNYLDFETTL